MNNIISLGKSELKMSSREIADLVNTRHDVVKKSIERLANQGIIIQPPMVDEQSLDAMNRPRVTQVYTFNAEQGKRDSIIVVAQLSPEFTAKLVDRWQELESLASQNAISLPNFTDPAEAAIAWANQFKAKQLAIAERDDAVRTKAWIGNKREATAMATASRFARQVKQLEEELGHNQNYATMIAVEKATGEKMAKNAYVALRKWCKKNGQSPKKVPDKRYGEVQAWPAQAWFDIYDIDLKALFPIASSGIESKSFLGNSL